MQALIVFDADNTLWDANLVFRNAQIALLESLKEDGLPVDPVEDLPTLRRIDTALGVEVGRAEYDFRLLVTAMVLLFGEKLPAEQAIRGAVEAEASGLELPSNAAIERAFTNYTRALQEIPPLFPGTREVLAEIRAASSERSPVVTAVLSEGNVDRLERILEAHRVRDEKYFDEIVIAPKSKQAFEEIKAVGFSLLPPPADGTGALAVMVGDALLRDIKFANQAGFVTVYKPSAFKGREVPKEADEEPDYIISDLAELLGVLSRLEVLTLSTHSNYGL